MPEDSKERKSPILNFEDTNYNIDSLSDESKNIIKGLQFADSQIKMQEDTLDVRFSIFVDKEIRNDDTSPSTSKLLVCILRCISSNRTVPNNMKCNGTSTWKDHVAAVKAKYPKPS